MILFASVDIDVGFAYSAATIAGGMGYQPLRETAEHGLVALPARVQSLRDQIIHLHRRLGVRRDPHAGAAVLRLLRFLVRDRPLLRLVLAVLPRLALDDPLASACVADADAKFGPGAALPRVGFVGDDVLAVRAEDLDLADGGHQADLVPADAAEADLQFGHALADGGGLDPRPGAPRRAVGAEEQAHAFQRRGVGLEDLVPAGIVLHGPGAGHDHELVGK